MYKTCDENFTNWRRTDGQTYIVNTVQTQKSWKIIVQTQASCNTHMVILVQTQAPCNIV